MHSEHFHPFSFHSISFCQYQLWLTSTNGSWPAVWKPGLPGHAVKKTSPWASSASRGLVWRAEPWGPSTLVSRWCVCTFTFEQLCSRTQEKAMAPHSRALAWKIPWTEEPGGLQSMGSLGVGHDWSDLAVAAAALEQETAEEDLSSELNLDKERASRSALFKGALPFHRL